MGAGRPVRCRGCGDVIQSKYRHDFVRCECGAIYIDGGSDYTRCGGDPELFDWDVNQNPDTAVDKTEERKP